MNETGVVKFHYESTGRELAPFPGFEELNAARQELRRLGLLGVDENGIGFGNVSLRDRGSDAFYVTGSGTGALPELTLQDYAKVVAWDFERNWLRSDGQAVASAESLTHAALYATDTRVRVVLHVHDPNLWQILRKRGIATRPNVAYGTSEMAREVERLFCETDVQARKIFAMSGHEDGIVAFGADFPQALAVISTLR
ncbi:MAG: class II aldolase/adducin family protein [Chthoniobacterales bacterium]